MSATEARVTAIIGLIVIALVLIIGTLITLGVSTTREAETKRVVACVEAGGSYYQESRDDTWRCEQ